MLLTNLQAALENILFKKLTQTQNPFICSQIGCLPVRSKPKQQDNLPHLPCISGSQRVDLAAPRLPGCRATQPTQLSPRGRGNRAGLESVALFRRPTTSLPQLTLRDRWRACLFGVGSPDSPTYLTGSGTACRRKGCHWRHCLQNGSWADLLQVPVYTPRRPRRALVYVAVQVLLLSFSLFLRVSGEFH